MATHYEPEDPTNVGQQLTGLMSKNNPLMRQAQTQGMQAANQRGLMNTSMGVQAAQSARLGAALPVASQQAQQAHQGKMQTGQFQHESQMQATDIASREKIAAQNVTAHEREKSASHIAAIENSYNEAFRTIAQNENLPANVRNQYLSHLGAIRDSNMALVEQLWGIELNWQTPGV